MPTQIDLLHTKVGNVAYALADIEDFINFGELSKENRQLLFDNLSGMVYAITKLARKLSKQNDNEEKENDCA